YIDLRDWVGETRYAHYSTFNVGTEADKFLLTIGGYSGDAGENPGRGRCGGRFSTTDQDNDASRFSDCASSRKSGWRHNTCIHSNLNGLYLKGACTGDWRGVYWTHWRGYYYSLQYTEMKMRPL
ncbi:hypothetical protein CAPTEDRAFT_93993, partial [Capitella teleta]